MTFAHLTPAELTKVQQAALACGFAAEGEMAALTADISPLFVATATQGGTPAARLITLTSRMNTTRSLLSGEMPLRLWLDKAVLLAAGRPEELVFRRALEVVEVDGSAMSIDAPDAPMDVDTLPGVDGELEVVIFEDDTLDVGFLHSGTEVSRSVAKLLVHRHFGGVPSTLAGNAPDVGNGTGWLIGPDLLITNFHVINARLPTEGDAGEADFDLQGKATRALFDFYNTDAKIETVAATECLASDKALDYAILRVPSGPRRPLRLRTSPILKPMERALQERVNVLQHPGGLPMRLGFRNNFVVSGTADRLSYLTDTAGGSSGSPICDDAWFVAALHRGFKTIPPGSSVSVWGRTINQENYGTPIGKIMEHLAANHPTVHGEVLAGQG
ncbi:trypsin-like peptidase domain-containing protein [Actinokineospora sp. HUAS TT18]|uniref:trypsin-like peptidase domain-containing protein n=1 Tax=Actinokineospora sp. HUAS TT18 TaxID=3447451 RepID=UPI003F520936